VAGDALDGSSLRAAVEGRDAVICALGTPSARRVSALLGGFDSAPMRHA